MSSTCGWPQIEHGRGIYSFSSLILGASGCFDTAIHTSRFEAGENRLVL
jgi:hypothetical protein